VPQDNDENEIVKSLQTQIADKSATSTVPKIEPEQSSGSYSLTQLAKSSDEEIAQQVIDGLSPLFLRLGEMRPLISELRNRFAARPRGEANIMGCKTWTEFCHEKLHYTDRAVRKALALQGSSGGSGSKGSRKADGRDGSYRDGFETGWQWCEETLKRDNSGLKISTPQLNPDPKPKSSAEKLAAPSVGKPDQAGKSLLKGSPPKQAQLECKHNGDHTGLSDGSGYKCEKCKEIVKTPQITQEGVKSHAA
jgi:hypothetical protein